ncbi:MAG: PIN domain-containing protein [Bacteroidota bacterium]
MSPTAIADTGFIVGLLNRRDTYHDWATGHVGRFSVLHTCEAVITEACFLMHERTGSAELVIGMLSTGGLVASYSVQGDEARIEALMAKYADVPMSFADACLVRMSERHPEREIVTADGDFRVYRRSGSDMIPAILP